MQLMPETAKEMAQGAGARSKGNRAIRSRNEPFLGHEICRWLFDRFPEIPNEEERMKFALAAYNGGRDT